LKAHDMTPMGRN